MMSKQELFLRMQRVEEVFEGNHITPTEFVDLMAEAFSDYLLANYRPAMSAVVEADEALK